MRDEAPTVDVKAFEGKIGILVDHTIVSRVRVCDVTVAYGRVRFRYERLATPGLNGASASQDDVFATDANVLQDPLQWTGHFVGWRIFFDPLVVERVLAIVAKLPADTVYHDDYTERPAPQGSRFVVIRTPGPIAKELNEYLWDAGLPRPRSSAANTATEQRDD